MASHATRNNAGPAAEGPAAGAVSSTGIDTKLEAPEHPTHSAAIVEAGHEGTRPMCAERGHVSKNKRQTPASFQCIGCADGNHTDVVAAIHVLVRGHRVLACGESASRVAL